MERDLKDVGHFVDITEINDDHFNEELKIGGTNANMSKHFGLKRVAAHYFKIPPGYRTSEAHAHSVEEEFVFVLEGEPHVYLDGQESVVKPFTGIDFKAGSGVAHTLINKSSDFIYYLCAGECEPDNDKIYYPEHPARNEEMRHKGELWLEKASRS